MINIFENDLPDNFEFPTEIAVDTETMGLKPHRDRLCLVQLGTRTGDVTIVQFKNGYFKAPNLVRLLNDPNIMKVFHYARFDVTTLMHHLPGVEIVNIFCTKIASYLARTYTDKHGLKAITKELLNLEMDKSEQTSYWGTDNLTEKQKQYAASDVLHLCRIKNILIDRLKKEGRFELAKACFQFLPTQAKLDLLFGEETDIFVHQVKR